ncbi:HD domain-containing phosphohydrolase [Lapillicoccus sp.]|uniref:HD-GYP domain-containing protein n=1 Tax=Lapillicoccus sp. TaxID=1909287 RepID=UPI0032679673
MNRVSLTLSRLAVGPLLTVASVVIVVAAVGSVARGPGLSVEDRWILLAFAVVIAVGELNRIVLPGARETAPMSLAAGFGLAMTSEVGDHQLAVGAGLVVSVTAVGMLAGGIPALIRSSSLRQEDLAARFIAVAVAALLFRQVPVWDGRALVDMQTDWTQERWVAAVSMVVVSGLALLVQSVCVALSTASREHRPLWRLLVDELRQAVGLSTALATSGALIALAERPMGIVALPVFLVPLVLTQFAVRRFAGIRVTYGQTIRALSRLTEIGGYTPPDHPARVATLGIAMGRDLGMSERDTLDLEYALLLHDIGQVALREPIPGGATLLAAPADQDRIARDGAQIVRQTGVLDAVAVILESQAKPYRQVRELGWDLPLSSRIIKVANAYDDLVGEARWGRGRRHAAAIERIHLGLGYEYDPRVVEALVRVLERRAPVTVPVGA